MVDNVNPVSNFHPYQPVSDVPAAERPAVGWKGLLQKLRSIDARGWVRSKPVLSKLAQKARFSRSESESR